MGEEVKDRGAVAGFPRELGDDIHHLRRQGEPSQLHPAQNQYVHEGLRDGEDAEDGVLRDGVRASPIGRPLGQVKDERAVSGDLDGCAEVETGVDVGAHRVGEGIESTCVDVVEKGRGRHDCILSFIRHWRSAAVSAS